MKQIIAEIEIDCRTYIRLEEIKKRIMEALTKAKIEFILDRCECICLVEDIKDEI